LDILGVGESGGGRKLYTLPLNSPCIVGKLYSAVLLKGADWSIKVIFA
jgi:hypothetical protein